MTISRDCPTFYLGDGDATYCLLMTVCGFVSATAKKNCSYAFLTNLDHFFIITLIDLFGI
jgi:hypothetical protein